ncbi:hypothetical protein [Nannocystis sp. SCPEA4]|uniref:tellurite resistance TerB family protein n=1 Tax=Nannocystis sp. SCPEA4 TaxID=2996787 RepID=UPI00226F7205|nr:hypothetical protein [Nannocystis sp. SCPEA4]MCY1059987.1 hypothetical protein [Nannocystis sp. SCPEA4]
MRWPFRSFFHECPKDADSLRLAAGSVGTFVVLGSGGFEYREKRQDSAADGFIRTASTYELEQRAPEAVVHDIEERLRRPNVFAWYAGGSALLAFWAASLHPVYSILCFVLAAVPARRIYVWNRARRTTFLFYNIEDPGITERLALAAHAGRSLSMATRIWHIYYAVATSDWKRNAGASTLIRRTPTRSVSGSLPQIALNIEPWCVPVGPQRLLFLPDRLFVWDGRKLVGLPYSELAVRAGPTRFIEDSALPRDARQVGTTWRYVNKSGGPDRRYSNNAQLPVMEYGELEISSASGLRVVLQASTVEAAVGTAQAIGGLSRNQASWPAMHTEEPVRRRVTPEPVPAGASPEVVRAHNVAILLRYVSSADRRITPEEIAFARDVFVSLNPSHTADTAEFEMYFRALPGDASSVDAASAFVRSLGAEHSSWVMEKLVQLSWVDGRATPKEAERIAEIGRRIQAPTM